MRRTSKFTILLIFSFLLFSLILSGASPSLAVGGSIADPSEIGVGARPLAMGMAFAAIADDGSAIYINPAGLGNLRSLKLNSMSGTILSDVNYVVLGAASPFQFGTLGIGYINVGVPGIPITTLTGGITPEFSGEYTSYNAGLFFLSYGTKLDRFVPLGFAKDVSVGTSAKIFLQGFTGGAASVEGASGTGFDIDLGVIYKPVKWGSVGVNFVNFLPEDLGGKFVWPPRGTRTVPYEEAIPTVVKVGTAVKVLGEDSLNPRYPMDLSVALDLDMNSAGRPGIWHLGAELWPTKVLALRAGIDQKPAAGVSGMGVENDFTAGIGIKYGGYTFDYAYHQYGEFSENTTHYFSWGYVGDERIDRKKEMIENILTPAGTSEPVINPTIRQKPALKTFIDVPSNYWAKEAIEYLATLGVLGGYPDGSFKPESSLTRAEISAILVRAKGIEPTEVSSNPYPDIPATNWSARYVRSASDLKFVSGYPGGNFDPTKPVTRAEGIVIVSRFAEISTPSNVPSIPFSDIPRTHWAAPSIFGALGQGMLDFLGGATFEPNKELTRAEVAELLSKTPWGKQRIKKLLGGA